MELLNNPLDFTVTIVTYNGAKRLPDVLKKLSNQINTETISWEVLVVDNNSTDQIEEIIKSFQNKSSFPVPLRYTFEQKQGAGYARQKAIQEAQSDLIGFLDDDNLPMDNWVISAYQFAQNYPNAGAYGSQIHGEYEVNPPVNFERIKAFLAITERGNEPLLYNPKSRFLPPSAGLVVRREAWLKTVPNNCVLTGRVKDNMLTSEDLEALSYLQQSDWEIWYNPQMEVFHKIPKHRLTKDYLIQHLGGIGLSRYITRTVGIKPIFIPFIVVAYWVNDLKKMLIHVLKYGLILQEDIVTAAERQLIVKSLLSPFYFWFKSSVKPAFFNQKN
ncbi:MAG: hormogonium polysaccharide biosynthesis glycosyltransferase HpsE [Crocosphaera sp.]